VRVAADKASNTLIVVKASPIDLATMKKLLRNVIDSGETDSEAVQRIFVIPVRNVTAYEMATVLRDTLKPLTGTTGGTTVAPIGFGALFGGGGANQQNNQQRPAALTIGTDDRTNSLVILSTETLAREVRALVEYLDSVPTQQTNPEVVRIVQLKG